MVDRRRFENIRKKIKEGKMNFEDACVSLLSQRNIQENEVVIILLLAEEISFSHEDAVYAKEIKQNDAIPSNLRTNNQILFHQYEEILNTKYPMVLHSFSEFLKELSMYGFGKAVKIGSLFLEKSACLCDKILRLLRKRTKYEIQLGYVPVEVLDAILKIVESHDKQISSSLITAINNLKYIEQDVIEIIDAQEKLLPWFQLLDVIIKFTEKRGVSSMLSLVCSLNKIESGKKFLYFTYYKNVPFFARVLRDEIKSWGMSLVDSVDCYIDPAFPFLAGALVIRPRSSSLDAHEEGKTDHSADMIIKELTRYTPCVGMRINYLYIEVSSIPHEITREKWNAIYYIFNLDVIKCEIRFALDDISSTTKFIGEFFNSLIVSDILSLSLYPNLPLSEKVLNSMAKNLKIESLILKEYRNTLGISVGIEEFLYIIYKQKDGVSKYIKELIITSHFQRKTMEGMQRICFAKVKKLLLDFIPAATKKVPYIAQITCIVNKSVFPALAEITVKNNQITKQEFDFIHTQMNLVQVKYDRFYCPSGSSYIEQDIYVFKHPENVSVNSRIVFIIPESIIYSWQEKYKGDIFSSCLICKNSFGEKSSKNAVILGCGSICHIGCITDHFSRKKNPCCPFCKKKVHLIKGLPMAVDVLFKPSEAYDFISKKKALCLTNT